MCCCCHPTPTMGASSSRPARALVTAALAGDAVEAGAVSMCVCVVVALVWRQKPRTAAPDTELNA